MSKKKAPDYVELMKQQYELDKQAAAENTMANRPTQKGLFGTVGWTKDPATGQWTQTETADPRVRGLIDASLRQQQQQAGQYDQLIGQQGKFKSAPGAALFDPMNTGMAAYDPASGDAYSKQFAQSLLARVNPQQQEDKRQMELKLRLQGLQPGTQAYNRAYQNLLTSQGDVQAQAQLQGMLAGGQESRDIYNTRLNAAMQLAENQRAGYQTRMQGQNQMNSQAMQQYLTPWQTAGLTQDLTQGSFGPYLPRYQGIGTAQGVSSPDMVGAAQQNYAQQMQIANDRTAKRAQMGSMIGQAVGSYWGAGGSTAGSAAGGAIGSYFSDASLKRNIKTVSDEEAYVAMMLLHPYTFSWPNGREGMGLIAQEVAEQFPQLVHAAEQGYLKVDYEQFTALLLGAFRYLAKEKEDGLAR
jgi:hypothetical protein